MKITEMNMLLLGVLLVLSAGKYVSGGRTTREPSIQAYGLPKRHRIANNGYIERIRISEGTSSSNHEKPVIAARNPRSIDDADEFNTANDLQMEEAKVFRPLFVYRQQIAKQRAQRSERERRRNAVRTRNPNFPQRPHGYYRWY